MNAQFIEYPKCSTCKNAKKFLDTHKVLYQDRHIVEDTPSPAELKMWWEKSGLPLKRFFNTSGLVYKKLELKDKLATMSEEEQLALLSSNGMLIKRPLLITDDAVYLGFKEEDWKQVL